MVRSDLLRVQDVRDAYRLIGECRDCGSDPGLWYPQMLKGLCQLIGALAAVGGEGRWAGPKGGTEVVSSFDAGLDSRARELYEVYQREMGPDGDPILDVLRHVPARHVSRCRRQVVSDADWYGSVCWNEYHRPMNLDDQLTSIYQTSDDGLVSVITLHMANGEGMFSARACRLLSFFHQELGPLVGRALVSGAEPHPGGLSPRLRQTLACLLEGDSEKQVASRLGLSHATTHEYVTALYRHFGVQSRAQLMSHAIKRMAHKEWKQLTPFDSHTP